MIPANLPHSTAAYSAAQFNPSATTDPVSFTYHSRLHPWCVICLLPKMQRVVVARFRRRNPAEEHLRVLKRLNPNATYEIVFDLPEHSP